MATSTAEFAAIADGEVLSAGMFAGSCLFPGVLDNEDVDLVG